MTAWWDRLLGIRPHSAPISPFELGELTERVERAEHRVHDARQSVDALAAAVGMQDGEWWQDQYERR